MATPMGPRTAARLALVACSLTLTPMAARAGDAVRVNGCGSCLAVLKPLLAALAERHRGVAVEMRAPLGSSGSMLALFAGALDLAVIGRPLRAEEVQQGARGAPYGRTPLLIVTHRSVPIENLTSAELENIYSGRTTSWADGEAIRVILRPRQETNTRILLGLSPGMAAADAAARQRSWALVAVTDPESDEMVSALPGAIGAACLASVLAHRLPLRIVALDGVRGTTEELARGRYPLAKPIILVTTARSPPAAQAIVDFVLSAEGRALAAKLGVVAERGGLAP